ncbi:hypothetical protein C8F04DRAFT_1256631 [Mycena alexandri]|uniref:Uncharacterized protein n=1 Tax=Mycena alexandri TaxID=1745969 RepID=A0AAD6XA49_9AGAR|nr:hypothetical protein C8F04DRAFT_1256631 [Mycena alexandri]
MSRRHKSKNPEVRKVAQDIHEIVQGLDPAVANRWFHYKPASGSSRQQENYSPLPSPEKASLKRKADSETVKSEPIDLSFDSDSDCAVLSSSHTNKETKKSASTDSESGEAVEMSFCALPPKTTTLGPFEFATPITFPDFVEIIAHACQTKTANLNLPSLQWKFDRPNNAKLMPVTNATGFKVMLKALTDRHKDYVFSIFMAPPSVIKAELPWNQSGDAGAKGPLDFEYGIDDMPGGSSVLSIREQLTSIDKASSTELNELLEAYPINNNPLFPGKRILHNTTGYFELTDIRLRVWAVAKAKGTAMLTEPPASNHFFKNQTIKPPPAPGLAVAPPPAPAPAADLMQLLLANPNVLQNAIQMMNPFQHTAPVPNPYGYMHPHYPHAAIYPHSHSMPAPPPVPGQLPPSAQAAEAAAIDLPREISLDEYCERYKVTAEDHRVLTEIGYIPGDDGIKDLHDDAWTATKVLPLAKGRILRQHVMFLKDVRNGLWN